MRCGRASVGCCRADGPVGGAEGDRHRNCEWGWLCPVATGDEHSGDTRLSQQDVILSDSTCDCAILQLPVELHVLLPASALGLIADATLDITMHARALCACAALPSWLEDSLLKMGQFDRHCACRSPKYLFEMLSRTYRTSYMVHRGLTFCRLHSDGCIPSLC